MFPDPVAYDSLVPPAKLKAVRALFELARESGGPEGAITLGRGAPEARRLVYKGSIKKAHEIILGALLRPEVEVSLQWNASKLHNFKTVTA